MNTQRRKTIREFAESVRLNLDLAVPFDVAAAVEKLGGRLRRDEESEPEAWIRALPHDDTDKFEVVISRQVAEGRYRFSVAHEIAHLFLHMGFLTEKWTPENVYKDNVMYRFGYSQEEAEANEFAATLLMPEESFREKIRELERDGKVDLQVLADHYDVSIDAARLRGRYLGLFAWDR